MVEFQFTDHQRRFMVSEWINTRHDIDINHTDTKSTDLKHLPNHYFLVLELLFTLHELLFTWLPEHICVIIWIPMTRGRHPGTIARTGSIHSSPHQSSFHFAKTSNYCLHRANLLKNESLVHFFAMLLILYQDASANSGI